MRLNQFINESRSVSIGEAETLQYIKSHCRKAWKGSKIYRGNRRISDDYYLVDPSTTERRSPFADNNYYNLLFSNLPSWKQYPKRNMSVVHTTDRKNASGRGRGSFYYVLPIDGANIGVCPESDIWDGFYNSIRVDLGSFSRELEEFLHENISDIPDNLDENYPEFLSICKKLDRLKKLGEITTNTKWSEKYVNGDDNFIDFLNNLFDPSDNDFKLVKIGSPLPREVEVWTDAKCILISDNSPLGDFFINDGDIDEFTG